MQSIINYVRGYFYETNKKSLVCITLFTAIFVFINYFFGLDDRIRNFRSMPIKLFSWWLVFVLAFVTPYAAYHFLKGRFHWQRGFVFLLILAPLLFALKMAVRFNIQVDREPEWNHYWNQVLYWPIVGLGITIILFLIWKKKNDPRTFYGLTAKGVDFTPYLFMLAIMVPLVAAASTQPDFLDMYPKIKTLDIMPKEELSVWHRILFEIGYASDFFNIELFFRGFLVLGFIKWAGKDAILPMACFYCTIHFGKPLGECISSYFGGILLGIVAYETRSILGGLLVHIGIAWMMELGGYIGNQV